MKFSDIFKFTVRRKVRAAIWKSEDAIERAEDDLRAAKSDLLEMRGRPGIERWVISNMEAAVKSMEGNLASMKADHNRFVVEQKRPSASFPRGISV
jgi:hypothetical protein